jgi:maltose-binding protein MalE
LLQRFTGRGGLAGLLICTSVSIAIFLHAGGSRMYAGGGRKSPSSEDIQLWHSMGTHEKEVLISLVEDYNSSGQQPSVQAVFHGSDSDLYLDLLSQDKLPDLVLLPVKYLSILRERGIVADISTFIPNRMRDDINTKYWDAVSVDEGTYGVPFSFNSSILYVNQYLLRISGARIYRDFLCPWRAYSILSPSSRATREKQCSLSSV